MFAWVGQTRVLLPGAVVGGRSRRRVEVADWPAAGQLDECAYLTCAPVDRPIGCSGPRTRQRRLTLVILHQSEPAQVRPRRRLVAYGSASRSSEGSASPGVRARSKSYAPAARVFWTKVDPVALETSSCRGRDFERLIRERNLRSDVAAIIMFHQHFIDRNSIFIVVLRWPAYKTKASLAPRLEVTETL